MMFANNSDQRKESRTDVLDKGFSMQVLSEANAEQGCHTKSSKLSVRKSGIPISLEEVEKVSGMKRKEAAETLNVSVSTLKRVCREFQIQRWPPRKKDGAHPFHLKNCVQNDCLDGTRSCLNSPIIRSERHVTVKAKYGNHFIRFQLPVSSGIDALNQQISKRLKLGVESYIVIYQDEDEDWILVACDDDLKEYIFTSILSGNTTLMMSLEQNP